MSDVIDLSRDVNYRDIMENLFRKGKGRDQSSGVQDAQGKVGRVS